ncbi:serine/threonine protein kinase [Thermobifida halotolerans]|uniref:BREX system serine/threonine kinase PglW n=1 Tax=Thermobifida halotolerans TaxID=483545 RepID=UPI00351796AF
MAAASGDSSRLKRIPRPAPPRVIRWFQEHPSPYPHEQEALDHIRGLMPPAEPFRAWATFCFTAGSGRVNECDLLILVPRGLFLLELKAHPGRLVNNGGTWNFHASDRVRTFRNPLHLTELKARELKDRLLWAAKATGSNVVIPRIEAAVFLSARDLRSELDEQQRLKVYGRNDRDTGLPRIWDDLLALPPTASSEKARRELFRFAQLLPGLMKKAGVDASTAHLRFDDDWELSKSPIDGGPTWEDRLAVRRHPIREEGRVRIYLVGERTDEDARREVERAAEREYQVLQGINHRGIVQALQFRDHRGSPAILFRHSASDLRLDAYLDTHGASLPLRVRLDLVRQLADALRYAHDRSLYHRALAARSVYVSCRDDGSDPVLRVVDWQVAARDFDTTPLSSVGDSSIHSEHVADTAEVYLAPEFDQRFADPVDLDLFGLGAVAYLVLTGRPPAVSRSELLQRLRVDGGLRPRAVADEVPEELDSLVFSVTRADVADRIESVAGFVAGLDAFEQQRAAAEQTVAAGVDPLEALPGQQVDDGWTVERVLGTGATSRVLLVRAEVVTAEGVTRPETRVLKVALDEGERAARLRDEAEALEKVGGGRVVRLLDGPRQVHGRTVLVLEYAGERSLGERLRSEGRLTYHELARFGDDLFVALDQLAGHGVRHRDIKPDNLGLFRRADRSWELKLFDFSLTRASDKNLRAGTAGYVDPFLGADPRRGRYDDHAEWYAAAVTLHEMASGERPRWGDEATSPAMTDDEVPALAAELFDTALRPGLVEFFERALHRDADQRFESLQQMREAWRRVFAAADAATPPSTPATVDASPSVPVDEARDRAAEAAELDTPLGAAGLSPAAESAAHQLGATTVGELLGVAPHLISRARGTGALVRRELNRRHRQWRTRLGQRLERPAPVADPHGAADEAGAAGAGHRLGVEELARLVTPEPGGRSRQPEAVRLLLGLPGADGSASPLPPWCTQSDVARRLGVKQPTVSVYHRDAIKRWVGLPELRDVRDELVGYVRAAGGVMAVEELAAELRAHRGTREGADDPRRVAALASAGGACRPGRGAVGAGQGRGEPASAGGTAARQSGAGGRRVAARHRRSGARGPRRLRAGAGGGRGPVGGRRAAAWPFGGAAGPAAGAGPGGDGAAGRHAPGGVGGGGVRRRPVLAAAGAVPAEPGVGAGAADLAGRGGGARRARGECGGAAGAGPVPFPRPGVGGAHPGGGGGGAGRGRVLAGVRPAEPPVPAARDRADRQRTVPHHRAAHRRRDRPGRGGGRGGTRPGGAAGGAVGRVGAPGRFPGVDAARQASSGGGGPAGRRLSADSGGPGRGVPRGTAGHRRRARPVGRGAAQRRPVRGLR